MNRSANKAALGDYAGTITDYDEAIRLNPKEARSYANRGIANRNLNNIQEAEMDFQTALELAERQNNEYLKVQIEQDIELLKR